MQIIRQWDNSRNSMHTEATAARKRQGLPPVRRSPHYLFPKSEEYSEYQLGEDAAGRMYRRRRSVVTWHDQAQRGAWSAWDVVV